ncbi:MAG: hypothetical protein IKH19_07500 [Muribaculaceae bacterium]|nr:hypothetical protein [Muribaculaceae bacterium]
MKLGKQICERLKAIRSEIARANEIDYTPVDCHHEGDCQGTCPACEREVRWLERQLRLRQSIGKAVTMAGISMALVTLPACGCADTAERGHLDDETDSICNVVDETSTSSDSLSEPILMQEPAEVDGKTMPEDPEDNRNLRTYEP